VSTAACRSCADSQRPSRQPLKWRQFGRKRNRGVSHYLGHYRSAAHPDSRRGRFGKDYAGRRICSASLPVRKNPAVMPPTKLSVGTAPNLVRLSTELSSFVADSFSQKICSTLRRGTTLYLREELPMFARILTLSDCSLIHSETSSDPAVTVPTNPSRSRILVLDPVLSRLLYFGAFAFILLSHSHL